MSWKSDYSSVKHISSSVVETHRHMKFEEVKAYGEKEEQQVCFELEAHSLFHIHLQAEMCHEMWQKIFKGVFI